MEYFKRQSKFKLKSLTMQVTCEVTAFKASQAYQDELYDIAEHALDLACRKVLQEWKALLIHVNKKTGTPDVQGGSPGWAEPCA